MRAVLDTNVYVSAFVFGGLPRAVFEEAERGTFELFSSTHIKEETERILREKFNWSQGKVSQAVEPLWEISTIVVPKQTLSVLQDESDNRILECAASAQAFCIVSGDNDLLSLGEFEGILIFTVREFLASLAGELAA